MPASSNLGTSRPGARVSLVSGAGPGNGVGRGAAGNANVPFTRTIPEFFDAALGGVPFSAAAPLLPSFGVLLFCWANNGKAKKALIATTRYDLRITFLLREKVPIQLASRRCAFSKSSRADQQASRPTSIFGPEIPPNAQSTVG